VCAFTLINEAHESTVMKQRIVPMRYSAILSMASRPLLTLLTFIALASPFVLSGCGEANGLLNTTKGGETVLTVDGQTITKNEYDKVMEQTAKQMNMGGQAGLQDNPIIKEILKQQTIQHLIALSVIEQANREHSIEVTPEEVAEKRKELEASLEGSATLDTLMKQNDLTEKDLNYQLKQSAKLEKLMQKLQLVKNSVTEEEIAEFYKAHEVEFDLPKQITSSHILIKAIPAKIRADIQAQNKDIKPEELEKQVEAAIQAKEKEALEIMKQVQENPESFATLAARHSEDQGSQMNNGSVGPMQQRSTDPAYWAALEKGKTGSLYPELVRSAYGFHIIQVGETMPAHKKSLAEVKEDIRKNIESQNRAQAFGKWMDERIEALKKEKRLVVSDAYAPEKSAMANPGMQPVAPTPKAAEQTPKQ
jgi:parvulin-like peptidyl-prolyl isomerase